MEENMIKSVIKEIVIILLLSIAIILILGILFYDYIPINKVIPEKEAYITPDEVKNEIEEEITESEKIEVTYEVTDSDLNIYKQSGGMKNFRHFSLNCYEKLNILQIIKECSDPCARCTCNKFLLRFFQKSCSCNINMAPFGTRYKFF